MSNPFDSLASSGDSWRRPSLSASNNAAYLAAVDNALTIEKSKEVPTRRKSHNIDMYFHDIQPGYAMGSENKELRSQISELQTQVTSLTSQLTIAYNSKQQLENELSTLRDKLVEYQDISAAMREKDYRIKQLESKMNEIERENTSLRSAANATPKSSNVALEEANKALKLLQSRLGTKDQMIYKLTQQNEQLLIKNEELKDIIDTKSQQTTSSVPSSSLNDDKRPTAMPPRTPITKRISPPMAATSTTSALTSSVASAQSTMISNTSQPILVTSSTMTTATLSSDQQRIAELTAELAAVHRQLVMLQDSHSATISQANAQYKRGYEMQYQQALQTIEELKTEQSTLLQQLQLLQESHNQLVITTTTEIKLKNHRIYQLQQHIHSLVNSSAQKSSDKNTRGVQTSLEVDGTTLLQLLQQANTVLGVDDLLLLLRHHVLELNFSQSSILDFCLYLTEDQLSAFAEHCAGSEQHSDSTSTSSDDQGDRSGYLFAMPEEPCENENNSSKRNNSQSPLSRTAMLQSTELRKQHSINTAMPHAVSSSSVTNEKPVPHSILHVPTTPATRPKKHVTLSPEVVTHVVSDDHDEPEQQEHIVITVRRESGVERWVELLDQTTQRNYYYNLDTKVTQWECPVPADYGLKPHSPTISAGGMENAYEDEDDEVIEPPIDDPPEDEEDENINGDVYVSELPTIEAQEFEHSLEDLANMDMLDLDDVQSLSEMLDWTLSATM